MVLYIDVLFLENVIVNYGILLVTGKLSGRYTTTMRKFISAVIGAAYLMAMLLCPEVQTLYTIAGKLLLSVLMTAIAFPSREIKGMIKALLSFYLSTFIFAGAGYALMSLTNQGIYFKNGEFYNQMKSDTLLLALTVIFGILMVRAFGDIFRKRVEKESFIVKASIHFGERTVSLQALIDTGNSLMDPVTQYPVMIAELDGVKELLPEGMAEWMKNWSQTQQVQGSAEDNSEWKKRIRLIPFHAIGTNSGMLPGFKPDSVCVEKEELQYERTQVVVCICQNKLSEKNQYKAIISPELVSA